MTLPNFGTAILAAITLKHRTDYSTKTVYVSNRALDGATLEGVAIEPWPILLSLDEIGAEAGEVLPSFSAGSIILDNNPGTFGFNRKFSDLLQRYTVIEQTITIYLDELTPNSTAATFTSADVVWAPKVDSVSTAIDLKSATISLVVTLNKIKDRAFCMQITDDIAAFVDAPDRSIGKYLPVIFGTPVGPVPTQIVSAEADASSFFYAAACSVDDFVCTYDATAAYAYDHEGELVQVNITAGTTYNTSGSDDTTSYAFDTGPQAMSVTMLNNPIICGVKLALEPNGTGASTIQSTLKVSLQAGETPYVLNKEVASGTYNLVDVETQNNAGSVFYINVMFDNPVVVNIDKYYYGVAAEISGYLATDPSWRKWTGTGGRWLRTNDANNSYGFHWALNSSGAKRGYYQLITLLSNGLTHSAQNPDGFKANLIELELDGYASGVPAAPTTDVSNLELHLKMASGLKDDGAGTITTSANSEILRVDHCLNAMQRTFNGTGMVSAGWSFTESDLTTPYAVYYAASGARSRRVAGWVEGYAATEGAISQLCKDTATRIGVNNAGNLFPWCWGPHFAVSDILEVDDILPLSWQELDPTSVINHVVITYGQNYADLGYVQNVGAGQVQNFSGSLEWDYQSAGRGVAIATQSYNLYGQRALQEIETSYINTEQSAETLAEFYLSVYRHPWKIAYVMVPYHKYKALRMFHVVQFGHPAFPSYYGAWTNDRGAFGDGELVDLVDERDLTRCETYRGIIEGRWVGFDENQAPTLKFKIRVLDNGADPT